MYENDTYYTYISSLLSTPWKEGAGLLSPLGQLEYPSDMFTPGHIILTLIAAVLCTALLAQIFFPATHKSPTLIPYSEGSWPKAEGSWPKAEGPLPKAEGRVRRSQILTRSKLLLKIRELEEELSTAKSCIEDIFRETYLAGLACKEGSPEVQLRSSMLRVALNACTFRSGAPPCDEDVQATRNMFMANAPKSKDMWKRVAKDMYSAYRTFLQDLNTQRSRDKNIATALLRFLSDDGDCYPKDLVNSLSVIKDTDLEYEDILYKIYKQDTKASSESPK